MAPGILSQNTVGIYPGSLRWTHIRVSSAKRVRVGIRLHQVVHSSADLESYASSTSSFLQTLLFVSVHPYRSMHIAVVDACYENL